MSNSTIVISDSISLLNQSSQAIQISSVSVFEELKVKAIGRTVELLNFNYKDDKYGRIVGSIIAYNRNREFLGIFTDYYYTGRNWMIIFNTYNGYVYRGNIKTTNG